MRAFAAAAVLGLLGCASTTDDVPPPDFHGDWLYYAGDGQGMGVTFRADGTFVLVRVRLISETSGESEVQTGTFVSDDTSLTLTTTQWSCPGAPSPRTYGYSFRGASLVLADPSGVVSLERNTAADNGAGSFTTAIGCFDRETGAFTARPLGPTSGG